MPTKRVLSQRGGVELRCVDEPDAEFGGACHRYEVAMGKGEEEVLLLTVHFQHGPEREVGVNGVQHVHMLEILRDRLRSFQLGSYASTLNEVALAGVGTALLADEERTARRSLAGVEGFSRQSKTVESAGQP